MMAKRNAGLLTKTAKNAKIDDASFWDDDLDDDCFDELASKALSQVPQEADVSILPSYSIFKPNPSVCSTQADNHRPHTINNRMLQPAEDNVEVHLKVSYLQQKYEEKEGEVSVLRSRLETMKAAIMEEQNLKHKDLVEKNMLKDKELNSIKSQLQFKNLEIANLKQKIADLSRCATSFKSPSSIKRTVPSQVDKISPTKKIDCKEYVNKDVMNGLFDFSNDNFLRDQLPQDFFEEVASEYYFIENKSNVNRGNSLHIHRDEEVAIPTAPTVTKIDNRNLDFRYIQPEIIKIVQCDHLNSEEIIEDINKLLAVSLQLMTDFSNYLEVLKMNSQTEDILLIDKLIINKFSQKKSLNFRTQCQIGVNAGKTVLFIGNLLPHCKYLSDYVILNKSITFNEICVSNFSCLKTARVDYQYLEIIKKVVIDIFILRKTEVCLEFLKAVTIFLKSLSLSKDIQEISTYFTEILKSILFARPPSEILIEILLIIRNCASYEWFLNFLCSKPPKAKFKQDSKKGVYTFNKESCVFSLFFYLFKCNVLMTNDENFDLKIGFNVLSFVYNIFSTSPTWVHYTKENRCFCLDQIFKLCIEVIYKILQSYTKHAEIQCESSYKLFFKSSIEIMRLMYFNWCELMDKHLQYFAKYRHICNSFLIFREELMLDESIVKDLKKHIENDDTSGISPSKLEDL